MKKKSFKTIILIVLIISYSTILHANQKHKVEVDSLQFTKSIEKVELLIENLSIPDSSLNILKSEISSLKKEVQISNNKINYFKDILIPLGLALLGFFLGRANFFFNNLRHKRFIIYKESSDLLTIIENINTRIQFLIENQIIREDNVVFLPDIINKFDNFFNILNRQQNIPKEVAFNKEFEKVKDFFSKENAKEIKSTIYDFLTFYNRNVPSDNKLDFDNKSIDSIIKEIKKIKADNILYK